MPMITIKGVEIDFRPLSPDEANRLRPICTSLHLHEYCRFRACRRHKRCATRQVLCHQAVRQEINAIIMPVLRRGLAETPPQDGHADDASPPAAAAGRRRRRAAVTAATGPVAPRRPSR